MKKKKKKNKKFTLKRIKEQGWTKLIKLLWHVFAHIDKEGQISMHIINDLR